MCKKRYLFKNIFFLLPKLNYNISIGGYYEED